MKKRKPLSVDVEVNVRTKCGHVWVASATQPVRCSLCGATPPSCFTKFVCYVVAAFALLACLPTPAPVPRDVDGAPLPTPQSACDNLAALGCSEGADAKCVDVITHVVDAGLTKIDLSCVTRETSKEAVRACTGMSGGCP